jgi:hypothetical protein
MLIMRRRQSWIYAVSVLVLFDSIGLIDSFLPSFDDYDSHGVKIAANDYASIKVSNYHQLITVQYGPYNHRYDPSECYLRYLHSTHYIYTVGVGIKQNITNQTYFFLAGAIVPENNAGTNSFGESGPFIAVVLDTDPKGMLHYYTNGSQVPCRFFRRPYFTYFPGYPHQEYYVMVVEPYATFALGMNRDFAFYYQVEPTHAQIFIDGIDIWQIHYPFYPCGADASVDFTVVAGFSEYLVNGRATAFPKVLVVHNKNLTLASEWSYTPPNGSWQSRLTYSSFAAWDRRKIMSVKVNSDDPTRVLVGMPFLNTVFMFTIDPVTFTLTSTDAKQNGESVGFGKGVTWLGRNKAAVLAHTFSLDYQTWLSSNVFIYNTIDSLTIPDVPSAILPNTQQRRAISLSAQWLQITSTPTSLIILDFNGWQLIVMSQPASFYAHTSVAQAIRNGAITYVSEPQSCPTGTYKNDTGVHPCELCPPGTYSSGNTVANACVNCSSGDFCPWGAVSSVDSAALTTVSQATAYPKSPELDVFEDILLNNMFTLGSTARCVRVSPIFWCLILLAMVAVVMAVMASMVLYVKQEKRHQVREKIKYCFQRTDLVVSMLIYF